MHYKITLIVTSLFFICLVNKYEEGTTSQMLWDMPTLSGNQEADGRELQVQYQTEQLRETLTQT